MTITANGKEHIADQLSAKAQSPVTLMAIGTGSPSASALGMELTGKRHAIIKSVSGAIVTYKAHWDVEDEFSADITEVGLFNNNNVMVASQEFTAVNKTDNDPFNVTWTLEIT